MTTAAEALFVAMGQTREESERVLGAWMADNGGNPKTHLLYLPSRYQDQLPAAAWPEFVAFSPLVVRPLVMRRGAREVR